MTPSSPPVASAARSARRDGRPRPRGVSAWAARTATVTALAASGIAAPVLATAAGAAGGAPYVDANAHGALGLCNQQGAQVTSGKLADAPFVWRVVSTTPAVSPYDADSRTGTLYAYQPRQGFLPGEWSGEALTASSRYSNPAAPMAAATERDPGLGSFVKDFPPSWDGFVQLRLLLGAAGVPPQTRTYPALDIQVTGSTWRVVGGASVDCHAGTAVSLETVVLPSTTTTTVAPTTATPGATHHKGSRRHHQASTTTTTAGSGSSSSGSSIGWVVAGLGVVAAGAAVVGRRRRGRKPPPGDASGA